MPRLFTCPQGHTSCEVPEAANREKSAIPVLCPVCGLATEPLTSNSVDGLERDGAPASGVSKNEVADAETNIVSSGTPERSEARPTADYPQTPGSTRSPTVAGYEILEELGRGGMGVVYKARQVKLDRLVALKLMPEEASSDATFIERFSREALALAKLNHPNIVMVHDFGQADGQSYLIMEFVDGENLRQRMRGGRMPVDEIRAVVLQVCDALEYAHKAGIVHRDVKPENILLDKHGRIRIADFGIAKLLAKNTGSYTLTGPWQVVGTLRYMAPEQLDDPLSVDHRADIYSLGVVVYEMLAEELPVGRFAPPSQGSALDTGWDAPVLRALEKKPEQRFSSVAEFKKALEEITPFAGGQPTRMHDTQPIDIESGQPRLVAVSILLVLAVIIWPIGLVLLIPGMIWLGLVLRRPGGKETLRQKLGQAERGIRGLFTTTRFAIAACLLGLLTCLFAWFLLPFTSGPVFDRDLLEMIAAGSFLALSAYLVASPAVRPIPIRRPVVIVFVASVIIVATGMLHMYSIPYLGKGAASLSKPPAWRGEWTESTLVGIIANGFGCALGVVLLFLGAAQMRGVLVQRNSR